MARVGTSLQVIQKLVKGARVEREKQERERVIYRSKNTIKRGQYQGKQHDLNRERISLGPEHERGQKEEEEKEQEKKIE